MRYTRNYSFIYILFQFILRVDCNYNFYFQILVVRPTNTVEYLGKEGIC